MNAGEFYREGRLVEAIDAALGEVKAQPADTSKRIRLSQLLLFAGEWDRADKQLEVVSMQAPDMAVGIALLRQLTRGEASRQQFFTEGRSPHFLRDDDPMIQLRVRASIAVREGRQDEAIALARQSDALADPGTGTCDGRPFSDWRDLDDLLGTVLEVITPNGKYYWINMASVTSLRFFPPEQIHDLIWRRATASIQDGPEGDVYVPVLYAGACRHEDDLVRLGRKTDWSADAPVRGVGQREWLVGEEARPVMEIERLDRGGGV